jgi:hypothetical protein
MASKRRRLFAARLTRTARAPHLRAGAAILACVFCALAAFTRTTEAHKAVTSKYNYTKDVLPILRDHCGQCHVTGGPAPMSLLTYKDAVAWAESVRDELTAERMPPWPLTPTGPSVRGAHPLSAHDLDVLVTWASGGTPLGDLDATFPDTKFTAQWKFGAPDLKVDMDAPHTLAAGKLEDVCDFTLPTGLTDAKWVRAVDVMPGAPSLVRDAIVSVEGGPVLALWQPGSDAVAAPQGAAFKLAAGAKLHLQIHYKKHFDVEQDAVSDRSAIGLYFADPAAAPHEIQTLTMESGGAAPAQDGADRIVGTLTSPARIVAVRPLLDRPYGAVTVVAIAPDGARTPLLNLQAPRPQWFRRYWLEHATRVPAGTHISFAYLPLPSTEDEPHAEPRFPLQVAVDYLPD